MEASVDKGAPSAMKAIVMDAFGGPEVLHEAELDEPVARPSEVVVSVAYAGVNPVDWKIREGVLRDRLPHHFPLVPGFDMAGTVIAVGAEVDHLTVGQQVFGYCRKSVVQWGTYAERVAVPASALAVVPSGLSLLGAAALPLAGLSAWQALVDTARLRAGQTVLVQAAAGGVGSLAVQIARHHGATVIGTARDANRAYVATLGAHHVIDYQEQDLGAEIAAITDRRGVDVVLDTLGGEARGRSFDWLAPGGLLVTLVGTVSPDVIPSGKSAASIFVSADGHRLSKVAEAWRAGWLHLPEIRTFPFDEAAEAQKLSQQGARGKIVIRVAG